MENSMKWLASAMATTLVGCYASPTGLLPGLPSNYTAQISIDGPGFLYEGPTPSGLTEANGSPFLFGQGTHILGEVSGPNCLTNDNLTWSTVIPLSLGRVDLSDDVEMPMYGAAEEGVSHLKGGYLVVHEIGDTVWDFEIFDSLVCDDQGGCIAAASSTTVRIEGEIRSSEGSQEAVPSTYAFDHETGEPFCVAVDTLAP